MTIAEEKKDLRRRIRAQERELSPRYKEQSAAAIAAIVCALPDYQEADTVFCFVGTEREIDTRAILDDALAKGKRLCLPLCMAEPGIMELRVVASLDELVPGAYGILEPAADTVCLTPDEVDFAVLPCLSCSRADIMTASSPPTGAARPFCAGSGCCGRMFPWSRTTCRCLGW